ncbi:unnamed protein product [Anisakis simplex]|uniref:SpoU_methylase domain-containing protein n=1 Tax=Anisakis simplex TaxID=6269 RepID=A0A0M3IY79_ANISI|nr:unnamed protein product [Anisakis simplex]
MCARNKALGKSVLMHFIQFCNRFDESACRLMCEVCLASERIGSITSWINVIMHIVKVKGTEEELIEQAFKLFVPWCTAQNFSTIFTTFPSQTGLPSEDVVPLRLYDECKSGSCPVKILCDDDTFNEAPSLAYSGAPKRPGKQMFVNFPDDQPEQFLDPLQRKIAVVKGEWKRPEGTSLIVIASLIDKMANIGGLCRTSEIFGAEKLVVDNAAIINNQNFKALSLSSENWITVEEVCKTELLIYLKSIRQLGYTIIAAEQTTNSVPFASFRFPPKSAILLGDEKEGVPVELIRYVDTTVEINQVGHTRSLNVHVTGALFIQKYAEQNNYTLAR